MYGDRTAARRRLLAIPAASAALGGFALLMTGGPDVPAYLLLGGGMLGLALCGAGGGLAGGWDGEGADGCGDGGGE